MKSYCWLSSLSALAILAASACGPTPSNAVLGGDDDGNTTPLASQKAASTKTAPSPQASVSLNTELTPSNAESMSQVAPTDVATYKDFLALPNTGITRLVPFDALISHKTHYESFSFAAASYNFQSDVLLSQGELSVGLTGVDYGFFGDLGKISLDQLSLSNPLVQTAMNYVPSPQESSRFAAPVNINKATFIDHLKVKSGESYILRSIQYQVSDVLVAIQVVKADKSDGSLTLLWQVLKAYPKPQYPDTIPSPSPSASP